MMVGIDLSDGMIRAVTVDRSGKVLTRQERPPGAAGLPDAVRDVLRAAQSTAESGRSLAVGAAIPWPGDPLPADVMSALADVPGVPPVTIGAGAASAVAEAWCGAAQGCRDIVTFNLGPHITAGVLVDGEVLRGSHGEAGLVSWLALNPVEREDYRRHGGLEAEISAAGIVRRLVWRVKSGDRSIVAERVNGVMTEITAQHVFEGAGAGDGVAASVVRDTFKYAGMAIANVAAILDPEYVVIGGTLLGSPAAGLEAIRTECRRRLRPTQAERLRIVLSTLGPDAVAIGAAQAALALPR